MSISTSQNLIKERAANFDQSSFKIIKSVDGPTVTVKDGPQEFNQQQAKLNVYDFNYYTDELDIFEGWFLGDLTFGEFKMKRELVDTLDRLSTIAWGEKQQMYFTRMVSTKFKDEEIIATIALVHGFAENQNISLFESAMLYAMNGFEVIMIDMRSHGFSSGVRGTDWKLGDNHENLGEMLKRVREDKPLFMLGHSMGAMAMQSFLIRNPGLNIAGVIY